MPSAKCGFDSVPGGASGAVLLVSYGPTLFVDIGFDPSFRIGHLALPVPAPVPGITKISALVDTGATESCIDTLLATQINLPIIDRRTIAGVSGAQEVNVYLAQIHIPSLAFTIYGGFAGVHLMAGGQTHRALLGRTFLQHYTMVYEGRSGIVTISN